MVNLSKIGFGMVLAAAVILTWTPARADDECRESCGEADLEGLCARLEWTGSDWQLSIRYEVELEDVNPRDGFDVVFTPLYCGRELRDASGEVIQLVASLQYDARCDDDDIELEDEANMRLPEELVEDPFGLRVVGEIVCRSTGKVLDDTTARVKVYSLPPQLEERVEVYEEPVAVAPPPPPPVVYEPPPAVIYRPYYRCRPLVDCRTYWDDGFVHVSVGW